MELNFIQMNELSEGLESLQTKELPFKLSLIIAKDIAAIKKESEFYIEQERAFAEKYLVQDENGQYVQEQEGVFRIKEGMVEECRKAREELNAFTTNIELRTIPMSMIENMNMTPQQLLQIESIIDEEA